MVRDSKASDNALMVAAAILSASLIFMMSMVSVPAANATAIRAGFNLRTVTTPPLATTTSLLFSDNNNNNDNTDNNNFLFVKHIHCHDIDIDCAGELTCDVLTSDDRTKHYPNCEEMPPDPCKDVPGTIYWPPDPVTGAPGYCVPEICPEGAEGEISGARDNLGFCEGTGPTPDEPTPTPTPTPTSTPSAARRLGCAQLADRIDTTATITVGAGLAPGTGAAPGGQGHIDVSGTVTLGNKRTADAFHEICLGR